MEPLEKSRILVHEHAISSDTFGAICRLHGMQLLAETLGYEGIARHCREAIAKLLDELTEENHETGR